MSKKLIVVAGIAAMFVIGIAAAQTQTTAPQTLGPTAFEPTPNDPSMLRPKAAYNGEAGFPRPGDPVKFTGPDGNALVCPGASGPLKVPYNATPPASVTKATYLGKANGVDRWRIDQDATVRCGGSSEGRALTALRTTPAAYRSQAARLYPVSGWTP
jgi:hypothetical protein